MRLLHISDSHSKFLEIKGNFDMVVHSGDFFPDNKLYKSTIEPDHIFQIKWLNHNLKNLKKQINNKPYLFTLGNHDFVKAEIVENFLRNNGVDAYSLEDKIVKVNDFTFYGFPYIPYICGTFNYERDHDSMRKEVINLTKNIKGQQIDFLVAHAPLHGILDKTYDGRHIGNNILLDYLTYKVDKSDLPKWYLCGHVHDSYGISTEHFINVSNAATTHNIIEVH